MGMYTYYTLAINGDEAATGAVVSEAEADSEEPWCSVLLGEADEMKWYEHEMDMQALSVKHPDVLFHLSGRGEEGPDWVQSFRNGKMCLREAAIPPFNPAQLC